MLLARRLAENSCHLVSQLRLSAIVMMEYLLVQRNIYFVVAWTYISVETLLYEIDTWTSNFVLVVYTITYSLFQPCDITNDNQFICITPRINLPPTFQSWNNDTKGLENKTVILGNEVLEFFLGFIMDSIDTYKQLGDVNETAEFGRMWVHSDKPVFELKDVKFPVFVPGSGGRITFKVQYTKCFSSRYLGALWIH